MIKNSLLTLAFISTVHVLKGTKTSLGEYPFMVILQDVCNASVCSGTLISLKHGLTTGHCCEIFLPVYVIAGDYTTPSKASDSRDTRKIMFTVIHPKYRKAFIKTLDVDVAVFKVRTPFNQSTNLAPIAISVLFPSRHEKCRALAWTSVGLESTGQELHYEDVKIEGALILPQSIILRTSCSCFNMPRQGNHPIPSIKLGGPLICKYSKLEFIGTLVATKGPSAFFLSLASHKIWIKMVMDWNGNGSPPLASVSQRIHGSLFVIFIIELARISNIFKLFRNILFKT
ncbi:serine protease VLSP-1-like isoform X1 [Hermetia illucens]|uniref:serine protease VLSP-1-like isoform X1 n=1 Tax=Hermetia illucens TaxID=343691 RepID=UPI0018CC7298|nr:serine protease VLSP-1-like isoform X1 [Hermetia illucens]